MKEKQKAAASFVTRVAGCAYPGTLVDSFFGKPEREMLFLAK
jgi:hypothetical protein